MKYYKLKKDLPTFKKGELFYLNEYGSLYRLKDDLMAYYHTTVAKFPNMLEDWFEEVPAPVRDEKTKAAFEAYIALNPEQRFFQAVRNFASEYLGDEFNFIYASNKPHDSYIQHYEGFQDTFPFECDAIHDVLKEDEEEEQKTDEY